MEDGYWTIVGYKVDIKQSHADALDNPSMPRPEIDIVAYKPKEKIIYLIEVKSYIDSSGVSSKPFEDLENNSKGRYKLLTWKNYRNIVSDLIREDLFDKGLIADKGIKVECGLIVGNLYKTTEQELKELFKIQGYPKWKVWGDETIKSKIVALAKKGYENNTVTIISKLMNTEERKQGVKERKAKRKNAPQKN